MTASWVARDRRAGRRPVGARVVVTGEGSAFCSGGNTSWIASEPDATVDDLRTRMLPFYRAWLSIRRLEVPTIAAVNGAAIGAGLCLALACDLRYAAPGASLGVAVRAARHAPGHGRHLPAAGRRSGAAHARDLLLTGRMVDADEALRLGLVSRVHRADESFRDEVLATAAGDRGDRADRQPADQARAARTAATPTSRPPAVGGAGPADHAGDRGPPGGDPRRPREAAAGVPGPLTRNRRAAGRKKRPPAWSATLAFPLRTSLRRTGSPVCAPR